MATAIPPLSRLQIFLLCLVWRITTHVVTSPFGRLKWIYRFHSVYNWFASLFSSNAKSRARECSFEIYISTLEAAYITENTGIPFSTSSPHSPGHKSPCPFHSPGKSCSIYRFRPFNCRTPHGPEQHGNGGSGLGYPSLVPAELCHVIDQLNNGNPKKDIRDFF
ncbi:MAG: hypothetical protein ABFE02_05535 [Sulfuricella sp.]